MTKDSKDAKIAEGEEEPEPRHGGDWFWGGEPPDLAEPQAKAAKSKDSTG